MEQIIVTRKDGATSYPIVSRQSFRAITSARQSFKLLGEDVVSMTVESTDVIPFRIGDYITVFGRMYTLNRLPEMTKAGANRYTYNLEFEGIAYEMTRAIYELSIDTTNNQLQDVQGDSLTGDLRRFASVIVSNMNRVFPGKWVLGTCPESETNDVTLSFGESDNCLAVAQTLCEQFNVEMDIAFNATTGIRTLNFMDKVGTTLDMVFKYGRGGGLYQLNRKNVDTTNVITRLKVYGSVENITAKYRANRLCLPGKGKSASFIEDSTKIADYGLFEACKYFDEIKPTFDGVVTAIDADVLKFTDSNMFDLNAKDESGNTLYLLAGTPAKIHFNTGNLAGYEFDIHAYDHATRTFTLVKLRDEYDRVFPSSESAAFKIAVGDKYKILDVALPESYVNDAESRLQTAGQEYFDDHCQPRVKYGLSITESYLEKRFGSQTHGNVFGVGDFIHVIDEKIGVDKLIRIQSFERDILNPYRYELTLSDSHERTLASTILDDIIDHDKEIRVGKLNNTKSVRQAWRASREILDATFDEDGHYFTDKIKPLSIDTKYLAVGAKAAQFQLINAKFQPNYNGNPSSFRASACILAHYAIDETAVKTWNIASYSTTLTTTNYLYLYAVCSKSGATGTFLLSPTQYMADADANNYYFLVGILNSLDTVTNTRMLSLSYGFSTINGRFITTGRIQSADGNTYFDLDDGEIGGRIVFTRDGQQVTLDTLGGETKDAKDYIDNTLPGVLQDIYDQLDGQIEQFFETYDPTLTNEPASTWTTTELKEQHLGDLFYNTTTGKVFRFVKENGAYKWQELADSEVAQALALANDALELARTKRRIFTSTPYTPYEVGDLWVQGSNGDIMMCKTGRLTGNYTASDWELASKYTNDASLIDFITGSYADKIAEIETGLDGKIESWFQTTDPASIWTNTELKDAHIGDMWYNGTSKTLKRYTKNDSEYSWTTIEDSTAVDAYKNAAQAQDTADSKRRVFVVTPYPPYDIGDLWVDGKDIHRCKTNRESGSFSASDWVIPVAYDNTKTVIDGGVVTSGTIQLAGNDSSIKAGITGNGTTESSIRMWAGATYENRASAPFRVDQSGKVVATNAVITGEINATKGLFQNVMVKGSIRSPFVSAGDSFDTDYSDNVAMLSSGDGWIDAYSIPWDVAQSGRVIRITNYKWGSQTSSGVSAISAPSGKYFYENGIQLSELKLSRECLELLGYGTPTQFYGWIVLRRVNLMTNSRYGREIRCLLMGRITVTSSGCRFNKLVCYDGTTASSGISMTTKDGKVSMWRGGTGQIYLDIPSSWFSDMNDIMVQATGYGWVEGSTSSPCKATATPTSTTSIRFDVSDDASVNDGSFMFAIYNMSDWMY